MPILGGSSPTPRQIMPSVVTPVSGTTYQNTTGVNLLCSVSVTVNPTLLSAASVVASVSPDGVTWTTYATAGYSAGIALTGTKQQLLLQIPHDWYYKLVAVNSSIDGVVAIG